MNDGPARDFIGYGGASPTGRWDGDARLAINFVLNVEEGSEPSVLDGDGYTENRLTDSTVTLGTTRDLAAEGLFEYGSRAGFWRIHREFQNRDVPLTVFACALALERNPPITQAIVDAAYDVCSHGYRWINHRALDETTEREQIALAVESFRRSLGYQPHGWYCRYGPSVNTRRLLVEHGGFLYDSDAYNDDLPYWVEVDGTPHLILPYSLDANDFKFALTPGWTSGEDFCTYLKATFDRLYREGETAPKMMSVGLHPRMVGRPGKIRALKDFIAYAQAHEGVWFATREEIARAWLAREGEVTGVV